MYAWNHFRGGAVFAFTPGGTGHVLVQCQCQGSCIPFFLFFKKNIYSDTDKAWTPSSSLSHDSQTDNSPVGSYSLGSQNSSQPCSHHSEQ